MSQHRKSSGTPTGGRAPDVTAARRMDQPTALALSSAHALIVQGNLQAATELLSRLLDSTPNPDALDLLARVYARECKWSEAEATWERLLQLDPNHVAARAALRRLSSRWKLAAVARRCAVLVAYAISILLGSVGFLKVTGLLLVPKPTPLSGSHRETTLAPLISQAGPDPALSDEPVHVPDNIASPPIAPPRLPTIRPTATPPFSSPRQVLAIAQTPLPRVEVDGCTVSTNAHEVQVVFDEGLFRYRCELSASGEQMLRNVAKAMSDCLPVERLLIEGHTDNDPMPPGGPYTSNYVLGFARAAKVAEWFRQHAAIPREALIATSCGAAHPPFSNEDYDSRLRNRTVVLKIQFRTETSKQQNK